jgi:integrase/recombinase XerD
MNASSPAHPEHIHRFLRTLRVRRQTRPRYFYTLRGFQRFALDGAAGKPPSMRRLCRWTQAQREKSPLYMVRNYARLVDRFLAWMTQDGLLDDNPFEQMRQQYQLHSMTPIVEALLSEYPQGVLEKRRGYVPFGSFFGSQMQSHVARMRVLGCRYDTPEKALLRFDRFLQQHGDLAGQPLKVLVEAWSQTNTKLRHVLDAQRCGRWLSQSLHRLDPAVPVLSIETDLTRRVRRDYRRPYIYSQEEICRLLEAAKTFPSPLAPLRPLNLYTMVVLTYCAGLRVGELARLTLNDVDIKEGTLEIRDTKFFKSRRLPLSPSVMEVLRRYLAARSTAGAPCTGQSGLFYGRRGEAYSYAMIESYLAQVIRRAGLKPPRGRRGPRIHDLRHTFVVHRMLAWYRAGINPQSKLPYLATYLGHKDIASTLIYMNYTPEVLERAGERLRQYGVQALGQVEV